MSRAPITPTLYDVCPEYRRALDDYHKVAATFDVSPCEATGVALVGAWRRVTQAASAFRKLKAVE